MKPRDIHNALAQKMQKDARRKAAEKRVVAGKEYKSLDGDEPRETCGESFNRDYQYIMTPTKTMLDKSNKAFIGEDGHDTREGNCFAKLADAFCCKAPILCFGIVNMFTACACSCGCCTKCRKKAEALELQAEQEAGKGPQQKSMV
jgi:hypothetical protein